MDSYEPKKLALLRILQILQRHSDIDHPLKQDDIARYLDEDYGIIIERKAIGRNISLLTDAGIDINSSHSGSYLAERDFTEPELRVLIDGVLSSKYISHAYSKALIEKLCSLTSKYFTSHVKHIHSVNQWDKTDSRDFFYNIEIIDEAIGKKKQITLDYNKYGTDKKLHLTRNHTISPYQMLLHNQRYYLMGYNELWKGIVYFRLDRITNIQITGKKLTPINSLKDYREGINYKELSTALPYMFADKPERIEFIADDTVTDQIIDWFGKEIRIEPHGDGKVVATVKSSPKAMVYWALQYAGYVRVTSPQKVVDEIKKSLEKAVKEYNDGKEQSK